MKRQICNAAGVLLVLMLASFVHGQTAASSKWVVSAKAGGVNFVEGTVNVGSDSGRYGLLMKGDELQVGDRVLTGPDGRAEILLNPGSYIRLGSNAEFQFETTDLDDLKLKLSKGSAMFEVFASRDFTVKIITPTNTFDLVESGIYRVDIEADGDSAIAVWKGRAEINGNANTAVKKGRAASVDDGAVEIEKFKTGNLDELANWSKQRGKELAKLNSSLKPNDVRDSLLSSFGGRHWDMFNSFGLWVFNPYLGGYSFLPFGSGWSSPYGHWYYYDIWQYRLPPYIYLPHPPAGGGGNQGNTPNPTNPNRGGSPPAESTEVQPQSRRPVPANVNSRQRSSSSQTPPYERVQRGGNINVSRPTTPNQGGMRPSAPSAPPVRVVVPASASPTKSRRP